MSEMVYGMYDYLSIYLSLTVFLNGDNHYAT